MKCPYCSFDPTTDSDYCSEHNRAARERKAKLIDAAPELAEALQKLVAWQAEIKHAVPLSYLDAARAALAKAGL